MTEQTPRTIGVVLFEGFELLDVFGPLEMFGSLPDRFRIVLLGPATDPVASAQGPRAVVDHAYADGPHLDVVFVPGGRGTRPVAEDSGFLAWLRERGAGAEYVTSVCTGSALLAAAGLLDGHRATSNKRSFAWVQSMGPRVEWVPEARWVEDGNRWTSGGVAAGIDMALALIERLHGADLARRVADGTEYDWHTDPSWDPFAAKAGLVER